MAIDSAIVCIIGRELLEAIMFVSSHIGAVQLSPTLSDSEKLVYKRSLWLGLSAGIAGGASISLAVGFSLADALDNIDTISNGVEAGEAASKLIAAFFVTSLAIKLPQWFGISSYSKIPMSVPETTDMSNHTSNAHLAETDSSESDPEQGVIREPSQDTKVEHAIDSAFSMSMSLFWNSLRECSEGGILTAIAAVLAQMSNETLGSSIALGVASAVVLAIVMGLGAKYISNVGFGVAATVIAQMLAVGLIAGSTRSFEQVYAANNDDITTPVIYDVGGTETGDILTSFEFIGVSDVLTAVVLAFWVGSAVILCLVQYYHNYLGYRLVPIELFPWLRQQNANVKVADGDNEV